ncbi:MAG: hypothetical protein DMG08_25355 [Acidobacteria bacterium]|nr:MAG: hypothetical protein DMG08_25355 [Acidobacteriota bacterium]
MSLRPRWRAAFLLAVLLIAGAAAYKPLAGLIFAGRLLLAVRALASGSIGHSLPVQESKIHRRLGDRELTALLYRPTGSLPKSAVMVVPGISELGCYHPRLRALARTLADEGFLVLTPDIEMFRRFEVAREALEEFNFWFSQMQGLEGSEDVQRSGIIGISFSGTMALIAAASPELRAAFVMAIGPYQDLFRCARGWFAAGPVTAGEGYYPTRFYGKWILMRAALNMIDSKEEQQFLGDVLISLLLQRPAPAPSAALSPQARRWYQLAVMPENQTDAELSAAIEKRLAPWYRELSPDEAAAQIRCPVFLAHGAHDDLIPPVESLELHKRIRHATSYLLISPFLTHTHPLETSLTWREKRIAVWQMLAFFYHLARTAR